MSKLIYCDRLGRRDRPAAMSWDDERAGFALELAIVLNRPVREDAAADVIVFGREGGKALNSLFVWAEAKELWEPL